jgi:SAM-dependent methyltransferase
MDDFVDRYLSGRELWGDQFTPEQIAAWYEDEREAFAEDLGGAQSSAEDYGYGAFNDRHGFRHLPKDRIFASALGLGSAWGGEFLPALERVRRITILEPSKAMRSADLRGVPVHYETPSPGGLMPFAAASFDLAVCFGVLHHIPNVSYIVQELGRVIERNGWALVREPIISMGDWRGNRGPGVTSRERGIPRALLEEACEAAGFEIARSTLCEFPTTRRLGARREALGFGGNPGVLLDSFLSKISAANSSYHASRKWQKIRPTCVFLVLRRR